MYYHVPLSLQLLIKVLYSNLNKDSKMCNGSLMITSLMYNCDITINVCNDDVTITYGKYDIKINCVPV